MASRQQLIAVHGEAVKFYRQQLRDRPDGWAAQHLRDRGLGAVLRPESGWRVGYAPDGWSRLVIHLRRSGFNDSIVAAGLASVSSNGYLLDRFRDRIVFVAHDIDLQPVGFIDRARDGRLRYLNTSNTEIYSKARTLVGLDGQQERLRAGAVAVLVEGTMDAAAVSQVGDEWVGTACCGTAITREQAQIVKRHSRANAVVVALDGNRAGRNGAVRSLDVLYDVFGEVLVATLPEEQDPASLFAADRQQLKAILESPGPLVAFAIEVELARWDKVLDHISGQVNAVRAVSPLVARLPASRVAGEIARLSRAVQLEEQIVSREVLSVVGRPSRRGTGRRPFGAEAGVDPPDFPGLLDP